MIGICPGVGIWKKSGRAVLKRAIVQRRPPYSTARSTNILRQDYLSIYPPGILLPALDESIPTRSSHRSGWIHRTLTFVRKQTSCGDKATPHAPGSVSHPSSHSFDLRHSTRMRPRAVVVGLPNPFYEVIDVSHYMRNTRSELPGRVR